MPCPAGGEHVPSDFDPNVCGNCAKRIVSAVAMGSHVKPAAVGGGVVRVVLLGHGTYCAVDGQFVVPAGVTIQFKVAHGSTSMGGAMEVVYDPRYEIRAGQLCYDYRLWPMVGENHTISDQSAAPYHHAHRHEHAGKFRGGATVWMYSARSGDGPRLQSICHRLLALSRGLPVEIFWLACREVIANNIVVQGKMSFGHGADPIVLA